MLTGSEGPPPPVAPTPPEPVRVRDPELPYKNGAIASDPITLRLAARKFEQTYGVPKVHIPKVVEQSRGDLFAGLADIKVDGRRIDVTIDTGKMTWENPDRVARGEFVDYKSGDKQAVIFQDGGEVMEMDGAQVSRQPMLTPNGETVYVWFAQVPQSQVDHIGRYTLISRAIELATSFNDKAARNEGTRYSTITVPAAQAAYDAELPEIVEANPDIEAGRQSVKFALDYTGARAQAAMTFVYRMAPSPRANFTFGEKGPVVYWFTETDDTTPFAVTVTKPKAWLTPSQVANFDF